MGFGTLIKFLGWGVPPGPENRYPISDQNIRFPYPISDLTLKIYTLSLNRFTADGTS